MMAAENNRLKLRVTKFDREDVAHLTQDYLHNKKNFSSAQEPSLKPPTTEYSSNQTSSKDLNRVGAMFEA